MRDRIKTKAIKFLQNSALAAISLIFALFLLEVMLRFVAHDPDKYIIEKQKEINRDKDSNFYEYDSVLGWKNKPLSEGYSGEVSVSINSKGLRDKEYGYDKPEDVFRILVLGDSFTWGYGMGMDNVFTEKLEHMLGRKTEVLNCGVTGWGTDQEYLFLEKEGMKYHPDLVLVAFAANDIMWDNKTNKHGLYPKPLFVMENDKLILTNVPVPRIDQNVFDKKDRKKITNKPDTKKSGFKEFLKKRTRVYPFLSRAPKKLKYTLLKKVMLSSPEIGEKINLLRGVLNRDYPETTVTKEIFLKTKKLTEENGINLAVLVIPYKCQLEKLPNPFFNEMFDFFEGNAIPYYYPYESFLKAFEKDDLYLVGDDHWNDKGHSLAAKEIYSFLKREQLIN